METAPDGLFIAHYLEAEVSETDMSFDVIDFVDQLRFPEMEKLSRDAVRIKDTFGLLSVIVGTSVSLGPVSQRHN